jgi:hypothetical protein
LAGNGGQTVKPNLAVKRDCAKARSPLLLRYASGANMKFLGLILLLLMSNVPSAQATIEYKSITPTDRDTLLEEVRNKPGAESREENGALRIKVPSEGKFYFFTLEKHPAHPSVVIRHVFEKNGAIWIEDTGFTAGDKKTFEQWLRQFEESQKAIQRDMRQR